MVGWRCGGSVKVGEGREGGLVAWDCANEKLICGNRVILDSRPPPLCLARKISLLSFSESQCPSPVQSLCQPRVAAPCVAPHPWP